MLHDAASHVFPLLFVGSLQRTMLGLADAGPIPFVRSVGHEARSVTVPFDLAPKQFDRDARIWILRDPKESPAKCTLIPLRGRAGVSFHAFDVDRRYDVSGAILLHCDGVPLSRRDGDRPLLVLDGAWRRVATMMRRLEGPFEARSIPAGFETAYPRRSKNFDDPDAGLASIEAVFLALAAMGHRDEAWLDAYHWRAEFLERNAAQLDAMRAE